MKPLTLEAGVNAKKYDSVFDLERVTFDEIKRLHTWLQEIRDGAFQQVLEIKRLLPQEVWDRYKLLEVEDFREQILLRDRMLLLRAAWRQPYRAKKEKRDNGKAAKKRSIKLHLQSTETGADESSS